MSRGQDSRITQTTDVEDRVISLGHGLPSVPERLLLAHAYGRVLFIAGAGVSLAAGLPDFRGLVLDGYEVLDKAVHQVLKTIPRSACNLWEASVSSLTDAQAAEVRRFVANELPPADRATILARMRRGPSRKRWRRQPPEEAETLPSAMVGAGSQTP